jgi:hypothetical protein
VSPETRTTVAWASFTAAVAASLLVLPFANGVGQALRTDLCRGDGVCGYEPPRTRCDTLSRDIGLAAALTVRERSVDAGRRSEVTTTADGVTVVRLSPDDDTAAVVTDRLRVATGSHSGSSVTSGRVLAGRFRFAGPDEARAWLEQRRLRYRPLHAAAVGGGDGSVDVSVGAVLAALGFEGDGTDRLPDEVEVEVSRQLAAGSYLTASGPAGPEASTAVVRLGANGSAVATGTLRPATSLADRQTSLATRLGMVGDATYAVTTDGNGDPQLLLVQGEAQQREDGTFTATDALPRLRESGVTRGHGTAAATRERADGYATVQTIALDLRGGANRRAFEDVFVETPTVVLPGSPRLAVVPGSGRVAVDLAGQGERVDRLVQRFEQDGVYVRERSRTSGVPATDGTGHDRTRETTLIDAYSQDFAVPASGLTRLPGCTR